LPQKVGKEFRPWQGKNVNAAELKVDILAKIAQLVEHDLAAKKQERNSDLGKEKT